MAPPGTTTQTSTLAKLTLPAKVGLGAAFFALIAFAYWFMFYSDVSSKIDAARKQSTALKQDLAQQEQAQASYFADRDELALRQQRSREFNKVLPADTQEAAFLSSLQQASNTSGIDLKGWQPQEEQIQTFYAKVPMRLEIGGKFEQIAKFTYEIGRLDRIINVENIELSEPRIVGDEVMLKGRCLATAFHVLKPREPAPAPGQPAGGQPK